jgi:hypothetical protein
MANNSSWWKRFWEWLLPDAPELATKSPLDLISRFMSKFRLK